MKRYDIRYTETTTRLYFTDADGPEEAKEQFWRDHNHAYGVGVGYEIGNTGPQEITVKEASDG